MNTRSTSSWSPRFLLLLPALLVGLLSTSFAAEEFDELEYKNIDGVSLKTRAYKPQNWTAADRRPAVVFFFGGGWANGTPAQFHEHCLHLAKRGMVALAADYRVKNRHGTRPPDSLEDAKSAMTWTRANAGKLGVDPDRIAAAGGSAGGHLAAALATVGKGDEIPSALVLFNPALDLLVSPDIAEKWGATQGEFAAISPFQHVTGKLPPTVIFHGNNDDAAPYESITAFVEKARKAGAKDAVLHTYEGRAHGFFNHGRGDGKDYTDTVRKMDHFLTKLGWLDWALQTRTRVKATDSDEFEPVEKTVAWDPGKTAIIIVDMWDDHHCVSAARRVVEMAPRMNEVVEAARERGVTIIHAPSDCARFYQDAPQRLVIQKAPEAKSAIKFQWNYFNPEHEGPLAERLEKGGCSCDTPEPCSPSAIVWTRQIDTIKMDESDAVSSDGQEIYSLLEERGIENVIVMGVHTNRCVLGRPFGIRQMAYLGKNVVLCRDLTDSYHRDPGKHFEGLELIVQHVEKYWCPTITSDDIAGGAEFRFNREAQAGTGVTTSP